MTDPLEAFLLYLALKQHFTTSYNYFKYGGKVKATRATYEKRNDKLFFARLAKHRDPKGLLISAFIKRKDVWIGDIMNTEYEQNYLAWKRVQDSLFYTFKNDIEALPCTLYASVVVPAGQHPLLLRRVLSQQTRIETMIALNMVMRFVPVWNSCINDPLIWPDLRNTCLKYKPFLQFDKAKLQEYLEKHSSL